jgi:type I restriction enzyme R subunit
LDSGNFSHLKPAATVLAELGAVAERLFPFDPASAVLKLRLFAETMAQDIASRIGIAQRPDSQLDLLRAIDGSLRLDSQVRQLFHLLRQMGNQAAHEAELPISFREGLQALKVARELSVWYLRSFGGQPDFKPGPFALPDNPTQQLAQLQAEQASLLAQLADAQQASATQAALAANHARQAEQERALAARAEEERRIYEELAEEASAKVVELSATFTKQQAARDEKPVEVQAVQQFAKLAASAASKVLLDEAATRELIDLQLQAAGWEADSVRLHHASGTRPERGRNLAIAEWPTLGKQAADYVLFAGLTPLAVSRPSAKTPTSPARFRKPNATAAATANWPTCPARLGNAKALPSPGPTDRAATSKSPSSIPATAARCKQPRGKRHLVPRRAPPGQLAKPLQAFHTPEGLLDQLKRSKAAAEAKLQQEGFRLPAPARLPGTRHPGGRSRPWPPAKPTACWPWPPAPARRAPSSA